MSRFELLAPYEEAVYPSAERLCWPVGGGSTQIRTNLDWPLTAYGTVPSTVADLFHIVAAAYIADLRTRRPPVSFSRTIDLIVHVQNPSLWSGPAGETLVDILAWISGDEWTLLPVAIGKESVVEPTGGPRDDPAARNDVMLLSGGLDSFCGAVDHVTTTTTRLHVGHLDAARSVRHAQNKVQAWLQSVAPGFAWQRHELGSAEGKREKTTRTRSLLFMTMAIAAAAGAGANSVVVPENGFTSMNIPLIPSRGGALSTKSTHPWTFHLVRRLLDRASVDIAVANPYHDLTKGELLKKANEHGLSDFIEASADTLSCAKLDTGRFKKADGGDPNINCGLCYACLVRRGAYGGAGLTDPTDYLVNRMKRSARDTLHKKRHDDLWALELAEKRGITEDDVIASAAWPPGTDTSATLDLVKRGMEELLSVQR